MQLTGDEGGWGSVGQDEGHVQEIWNMHSYVMPQQDLAGNMYAFREW